MTTSVHSYSIAWSDRLIRRVETLLRDVHFAVGELYDKNAYDRRVPLKVLKSAGAKSEPAHGDEDTPMIDAISPAGSFMLRTTVHRTPFEEDHVDTGIGADIVLTMPNQVCNEVDLQEGRYLSRRQVFVEQVLAHLKRVQEAAARQVQQRNDQNRQGEGQEDEEEDEESAENGKNKKKPSAGGKATAERLSRMEITMLPIHGCFGCHEKKILRIRFRRRTPKHATSEDGTTMHSTGALSPMYYESPYIDVHFRPAMHSGRVSGTKATRKHPLYSYLVLEDYMMPSYLQKLHQLCVDSPGLRRAIVLLKCWALHMGLHAPSSGHSEGLNGFILSAMVLNLMEEGVVNPGMNEETAARAVLVHISSGAFTRACTLPGVPAMEEKGMVAVMRFQGEALNILFRSSAAFFKLVVEKAAQEALQYPKLAEVFVQAPFQPLPLRHDVALSIHNCPRPAGSEEGGVVKKHGKDQDDSEAEEEERGEASLSKGMNRGSSSSSGIDLLPHAAAYFSPIVEWSHEVRELALTALQSRAMDVTVWNTDASTLQITVLLTSEADGRRRLTRGPAVEDTKAVEAFNTFWGPEITSTRQFADGAIYRCVLWNFPENIATTTATQQVLTYALRKNIQNRSSKSASPLEVSVLLGGLEGFLCERIGGEWKDASPYTQKPLWDATKDVHHMIAKLPKSAIPCKIVSLDMIAATERLTEVFPVRPHLALTFTTEDINPSAQMVEGENMASKTAPRAYNGICTTPSIEPIHCVMTIDDRRRIPDDLEAIQLMKAAIGAQLSKALNSAFGKEDRKKDGNEEEENGAEGRRSTEYRVFSSCHPHGVDIAYHGYLFRIYIAHYREVSLLRALQMTPRADMLEQKLFWSVQHAKLLRSIAFGHPTFPTAVRLAKRWLSAMCLYEFIVPEVVELLVANAYLMAHESSVTTLTNIHANTTANTNRGISAPKTAAGGFIRFIELVATHDWSTPLVLPTTDEAAEVSGSATDAEAAKLLRLQQKQQNPQQAMFIATPYAPTDSPFTKATPRQMVLHRLVALAKGAHSVLLRHLRYSLSDERRNKCQDTLTEALLFRTDLSVFDIALPLHPKTLLHPDRSTQPVFLSTRSHSEDTESAAGEEGKEEALGSIPHTPGGIQRVWQLDELDHKERVMYLSQRIERDPVGQAVRSIRSALRDRAMVFYDALAPSELYVVALTESPPTARVCWELARDVCEAGMGAVLPNPVRLSCSSHSDEPDSQERKVKGPRKGEGRTPRSAELFRKNEKSKGKKPAALQKSERKNAEKSKASREGHTQSSPVETSKRKRVREYENGMTEKNKKKQKVSRS